MTPPALGGKFEVPVGRGLESNIVLTSITTYQCPQTFVIVQYSGCE